MLKTKINKEYESFTLIRLHTLIVGSGAAGLNAAIQLYERGVEDIAIVTEKWGGGTSNNAGSDKQTYYRLAPFGKDGDSAEEMAKALFSGGSMHGDMALIESAYSLQAFYNLVNAGVPFPHDELGRYPGYQTDHDTRGRGTSAGPLTSRFMFRSLAKKIVDYQIPIFDSHQIVRVLHNNSNENRTAHGALVLDLNRLKTKGSQYVVFQTNAIIMATGGPGELFEASVYPEGQYGATGVALELGAAAQNLTEFQFGIASTKYRWNLSGSYQQVIPRYYSLDIDGKEHDFLNDYFPDPKELCKAIFLKGYQWPFDPRKLDGPGSSLIDILVHRERKHLGRKVFLDFRQNPKLRPGFEFSIVESLHPLAKEYIENCQSLAETPYERLLKMNKPAIDLYRRNGIDLEKESLEIDICAQHCNGGIAGSIWWESTVTNFFTVGEANGSHGVYRPGGTALNSGQVGGIRAAKLISQYSQKYSLKQGEFLDLVDAQLRESFHLVNLWTSVGTDFAIDAEFLKIKHRMTESGGIVRNRTVCLSALEEIKMQRDSLDGLNGIQAEDAPRIFRLREQLLVQEAIITSILIYIEKGGDSRGAYIIENENGDMSVSMNPELVFSMDSQDSFVHQHILSMKWNGEKFEHNWDEVTPIPIDDQWFETIWKDFREKKIIKR